MRGHKVNSVINVDLTNVLTYKFKIKTEPVITVPISNVHRLVTNVLPMTVLELKK